jgi:hypothetical protein
LIFLDYLAWDKGGRRGDFYFEGECQGSLAATLGNPIDKDGLVKELFSQVLPNGKTQDLAKQVFRGQNVHGKDMDQTPIAAAGAPAKPPEPLSSPKPELAAPPAPKPHADPPNFPELLPHTDLILTALQEGKTLEEIWLWLKSQRIVTTISRVGVFCQALSSSEQSATLPPLPRSKPAPASATELLDEPTHPQAESFKLSTWLAKEFRAALRH